MKNKDLIISLIQQDLKHNQLVEGLENLGLDGGGLHYLGVLELVCRLMKVPENVQDQWSELYIGFMKEAAKHEIEEKPDSLRPLAEVCYYKLKHTLRSA